ncbi:MAG: hypothetical protein OEV44_14660 [Spirochaetota bacterium]|nr:hypothetical protein [Spirochaetota bacterium]
MKKGFLIITILIFFNSFLSAEYFIRFNGGAGYTASESMDVGNGKLISYKISTQVAFSISPKISIGSDIGYTHLLYAKLLNETRTYDYINICFFSEYKPFKSFKWIILQSGIGPYFPTGNNKGERLGIFISPGVDLPITQRINIPILIRADLIIGNPFIIPINFMTGLTFKY